MKPAVCRCVKRRAFMTYKLIARTGEDWVFNMNVNGDAGGIVIRCCPWCGKRLPRRPR